MIANVPGSVPPGVEAVAQRAAARLRARTSTWASRATTGELVLVGEPRRGARAGRGRRAARLHGRRIRAAASPGPRMVFPDGTLAAVAPALPDGRPARSSGARRCAGSSCRSAATSTSTRRRPTEPVQADWMLGGFLLLRRAMLDELGGFDEGFRLYGEDIDLAVPRDARRLGALVRPGGRRPPRAQGGDRQALADAAHALALGGHRALRRASTRSGCGRCEQSSTKFDRDRARATPSTTTPTRRRYARGRARADRRARPAARSPATSVLDLALRRRDHGGAARSRSACATAASTAARG